MEDHFPDLQTFLDSVKLCMMMERCGGTAFTDRETYRLKKIMVMIWAQLGSANQATHASSV